MIVTNANLVTFSPAQPLVEGALVAVEGKTVVDFGKVGKLVDRYDDPEVLDVSGRLVLPGGVNAHDRLYLRFAPGAPAGGVRPRSPREVRKLRHRIENSLDETSIYWSAVAGLLDAVRCGVTTVLALCSSPMHVEGSLEVVSRAFREIGLRGALAYGLSPRSNAAVAMKENLRHLEACRDLPGDLLRGLLGAEDTTELDGEWLAQAAEVDAPVHVVLEEDSEQLEVSLTRHGRSAGRRLAAAGLLRRPGLALHAGAMDRQDEDVLLRSGLFYAHAARSGLVSGAAAPDLMRAASVGLPLALGTGGWGASLLEEFRVAAFRQRARGHDLADAVRLAHRAAFAGNADLATAIFGAPVGRLKPGARADLVVFDYWPSTPLTAESLPEHLFWGAERAPVHTVIVNGAIVVQNGKFVTLDEERLRAKAREAARALWDRL